MRLNDLAVAGAARRKRQIERGATNQFAGSQRLIPFDKVVPGAFDSYRLPYS